ncbi:MAG: glycosyltransferase family 2 protein [Clostridium sp.]
MGVSVVIPNYNGEKYIRGCLESLKNQSLQPDEIIIVDNASRDGSIDLINSEYKDYVTLICMNENHGFSIAVNEGIKRSNYEFVALLNNDTELDSFWLENLYNCIKRDEKIFSCCSKMMRYDNREIIDDAGDEYTIFGWATKRGDGKLAEAFNKSEEVFSSCAGAAIYRRSVFDEIGFFDENFFAYLEDIDISYRARVYGYKNYYCNEALVYHIGSATSGSRHNEFKVRLASRNNIYVIHKNMTGWQMVLNGLFIIGGIAIKGVFFSLKGFGKVYFSGVLEGIKNRSSVQKIRLKNNKDNYLNIQKQLYRNTLNLLKGGR